MLGGVSLGGLATEPSKGRQLLMMLQRKMVAWDSGNGSMKQVTARQC